MYAGSSIDWGKIAQQWIQMRDKSGSSNLMPAAPPPPNISGQPLEGPNFKTNHPSFLSGTKKTAFEEHGVADMDMDDEDENGERDQRHAAVGSTNATSGPLAEQSSIMQAQWFMQQIESQQSPKPAASNAPTPPAASQWNMWSSRGALSPPVVPAASTLNSTAHIPSLMKINVPNPNAIRVQTDALEDEASSSAGNTMDAAKRKMLPAWIREGLEKMEREKQKQLEREQQKNNSKDYNDDRLGLNYSDGENLNTLNDSMVITNSPKRLESDSSGNEDDEDVEPNDDYIDGKALETVDSSAIVRSSDNEDADELEQSIGKSYEQKLADLMIVVRRNLTELLLEVTNEEIANIAQETINSHKSKASSAQVIRKSALSSITGKLGLAAYADSSSDSNSSDSENEGSSRENGGDSEEDIQASIRSKRRAFAKISEDIEERVAAAAIREELKLKHYLQIEEQRALQNQDIKRNALFGSESQKDGNEETRGSVATESAYAGGKGYDREFGETTESKLQQTNGKRQKDRLSRKERTTRFTDNKDSKIITALPTVPAFIAQFPIANTSIDTIAAPSNLYTVASSSHSSTAATHAYIAAEATLDRVTKNKSSSVTSDHKRRHHERNHRDRHSRRNRRSRSSDDYSSSSTSTDTDDSTASTDSSRESKYSRDSSMRRREKAGSHSSKRHRKSSSSTSKSKKSTYHSSDQSKRRRKRHSSTNSDDYDSRDYYRSRHSSSKHSRRSRSRSRSRSKSKSSYSSSSRRRH